MKELCAKAEDRMVHPHPSYREDSLVPFMISSVGASTGSFEISQIGLCDKTVAEEFESYIESTFLPPGSGGENGRGIFDLCPSFMVATSTAHSSNSVTPHGVTVSTDGASSFLQPFSKVGPEQLFQNGSDAPFFAFPRKTDCLISRGNVQLAESIVLVNFSNNVSQALPCPRSSADSTEQDEKETLMNLYSRFDEDQPTIASEQSASVAGTSEVTAPESSAFTCSAEATNREMLDEWRSTENGEEKNAFMTDYQQLMKSIKSRWTDKIYGRIDRPNTGEPDMQRTTKTGIPMCPSVESATTSGMHASPIIPPVGSQRFIEVSVPIPETSTPMEMGPHPCSRPPLLATNSSGAVTPKDQFAIGGKRKRKNLAEKCDMFRNNGIIPIMDGSPGEHKSAKKNRLKVSQSNNAQKSVPGADLNGLHRFYEEETHMNIGCSSYATYMYGSKTDTNKVASSGQNSTAMVSDVISDNSDTRSTILNSSQNANTGSAFDDLSSPPATCPPTKSLLCLYDPDTQGLDRSPQYPPLDNNFHRSDACPENPRASIMNENTLNTARVPAGCIETTLTSSASVPSPSVNRLDNGDHDSAPMKPSVNRPYAKATLRREKFDENDLVSCRLGDKGRAVLKSKLSQYLKNSPPGVKAMAESIAGVRFATTKQLYQLAKLCNLDTGFYRHESGSIVYCADNVDQVQRPKKCRKKPSKTTSAKKICNKEKTPSVNMSNASPEYNASIWVLNVPGKMQSSYR